MYSLLRTFYNRQDPFPKQDILYSGHFLYKTFHSVLKTKICMGLMSICIKFFFFSRERSRSNKCSLTSFTSKSSFYTTVFWLTLYKWYHNFIYLTLRIIDFEGRKRSSFEKLFNKLNPKWAVHRKNLSNVVFTIFNGFYTEKGFILFYVNLSICEKINSHEYAGTI